MTRTGHSRLWTPMAAAIAGSAISISVGFGRGNWDAVLVGEVVTAIVVLAMFVVGAEDSDVGAVLGHRADERQQLVRFKAMRLSLMVAVAAMVIATVVAAAIDATYWPFELLYGAAGISYLVGLGVYGARARDLDASGAESEQAGGLMGTNAQR